MHTGMLWFDNSKTYSAEKIKKAAEYYTKKYGSKPDTCYVPLTMMFEKGTVEIEISVIPHRFVLPDHIWIGIDEV